MSKKCRKCEGAGKVEDLIEGIIDYIHGADDFPCEKCPRCEGTGEEPPRDTFRYELDKLYPSASEVSTSISVIQRLLGEAYKRASDSIEALDNGDVVAADDQMQHLKALIPELCCWPDIGDPFLTVVIGIFHGLQNTSGEPTSKSQTQAIRFAIHKINSEPFLSYDDALDVVRYMEETGLVVEPAEFEYLADMLDV